MKDRAWPWPGDSPVVVARRVALAYRSALHRVDALECIALDDRMHRYGQTWAVAELITFELDDWLSPRQAADLASVRVSRIAEMRRAGRLTGRWVRRPGRGTDGGFGWEYQARDVLSLSAGPRSRRKREDSA